MEVVHRFYPGRAVDGMTMDTDGNVYATAGRRDLKNTPGVYVFSPDNELLAMIETSDMPTNCTFGGPGLSTLYITATPEVDGDGGRARRGFLYRIPTTRTGRLWWPRG